MGGILLFFQFGYAENIAPHTISIPILKGDTLWGIASNYLNNPFLWPELLKYNHIENPDLIRAGERLHIPVSTAADAKSALERLEVVLESGGIVDTSTVQNEMDRLWQAYDAGDFGLAHGLASRKLEETTGEKSIRQHSVMITDLRGKVLVRSVHEVDWRRAKIGMNLKSGDQVRTLENSYTQITFDGSSKLDLKPEALIIIGYLTQDTPTRIRRSSIQLIKSDLSATLTPSLVDSNLQFQISTPSATADIENQSKLYVSVADTNQVEFRLFAGTANIQTPKRKITLTENRILNVSSTREHVDILPLAPALIQPENQKIYYVSSPNFDVECHWSAVEDAAGYHLEVARNSSFSVIRYDFLFLDKNKFILSGLDEGIYYWRVSTIDEKQTEGMPSNSRVFMVRYDSPPPPNRDDYTPPFLMVNEPQIRKGEVYFDSIFISGETEPQATVLVNGTRVSIDRNGNFGMLLKDRMAGINIITIESYDFVGNVRYLQKEVIIDK